VGVRLIGKPYRVEGLNPSAEQMHRLCLQPNRDGRRCFSSNRSVWRDHILITPGVRSGKPRLVGTRITVQDVLEYLAGGDTAEGLQEAFPELTAERVRACLAFAAERERLISANP
jgi:uncharacterized protein (DUF433 family)